MAGVQVLCGQTSKAARQPSESDQIFNPGSEKFNFKYEILNIYFARMVLIVQGKSYLTQFYCQQQIRTIFQDKHRTVVLWKADDQSMFGKLVFQGYINLTTQQNDFDKKNK